jgi:hypothetical protein
MEFSSREVDALKFCVAACIRLGVPVKVSKRPAKMLESILSKISLAKTKSKIEKIVRNIPRAKSETASHLDIKAIAANEE